MKSLPRIGPSDRDDEITQNLQGSKTRSDGALTCLVAEAEAEAIGFWVGEGGRQRPRGLQWIRTEKKGGGGGSQVWGVSFLLVSEKRV